MNNRQTISIGDAYHRLLRLETFKWTKLWALTECSMDAPDELPAGSMVREEWDYGDGHCGAGAMPRTFHREGGSNA